LALKSLRRRLSHKNPNVQIQSLHVLDVLVKNSGEALLLAVANGKDGWLTQVEELCRSSNHDLQQLSLKYVQNWALAFQSRDTSVALSSSDLVHLYNRLHYSLSFPAASQSLTSSMITSMSAPEWVDDELCQRCRTAFTMTNRKHHCRNCGGVFCGDCSSKNMKLEHLGIDQEVRVCDGCYKKLSMPGGRSASISKAFVPDAKSAALTHRSSNSVSADGRKSQEEIDFERAIAMSLAESSAISNASAPPSSFGQSNALPGVGYGYEARPSQPYKVPPVASAAPTLSEPASMPSKQLEEEDPDLAAAIRASLAEVQPQASTSAAPTFSSALAAAPYVYTPQNVPQPSVPSYELALAEFDALDSFSAALPPRQLSMDDANELFYRADKSRGKMIRALEDSAIKTDMLAEINGKLQRAVRLYDNLLERRISRYSQPAQQGYYSGPQGMPQQYQQPYQTQQPYQPEQQPSYAQPPQQYQYHPQQQQAQQPQHERSYQQSTQQQQYAQSPMPVYDTQQTQQQQQQQTSYAQTSERNPWQESSQPEAPQGYAQQGVSQQHYIPQAHEHQHQQQTEDSQYYNETPQKSYDNSYAPPPEMSAAHATDSPQASAPYASPSQSRQNLPPMSPSLASQPAYGQPQASVVEPHHHANGYAQPAHQQETERQQQSSSQPAENAVYDAAGNKLRLQGYYTQASFPAVPAMPVGGLPSAPNGELHQQQGHHTAEQEAPKKQEEALIEF